MSFTVRFSSAADDQLASLYRDVEEASSPQVAAVYVDDIVTCCEAWLRSRTAEPRETS